MVDVLWQTKILSLTHNTNSTVMLQLYQTKIAMVVSRKRNLLWLELKIRKIIDKTTHHCWLTNVNTLHMTKRYYNSFYIAYYVYRSRADVWIMKAWKNFHLFAYVHAETHWRHHRFYSNFHKEFGVRSLKHNSR